MKGRINGYGNFFMTRIDKARGMFCPYQPPIEGERRPCGLSCPLFSVWTDKKGGGGEVQLGCSDRANWKFEELTIEKQI